MSSPPPPFNPSSQWQSPSSSSSSPPSSFVTPETFISHDGLPRDDYFSVPPRSRPDHLMIGDTEDVSKFYEARFRDLKQVACKSLSKAFVKLLEPKKQSKYPYRTKGQNFPPLWWPISEIKELHVRHIEPDHLSKPERLRLLVHILTMVVQPPGRKFSLIRGLNATELHRVAVNALGTKFENKDIVEEIFQVAKLEERFLSGEIDGSTTVSLGVPAHQAPRTSQPPPADLFRQKQILSMPRTGMVDGYRPIQLPIRGRLVRPLTDNFSGIQKMSSPSQARRKLEESLSNPATFDNYCHICLSYDPCP